MKKLKLEFQVPDDWEPLLAVAVGVGKEGTKDDRVSMSSTLSLFSDGANVIRKAIGRDLEAEHALAAFANLLGALTQGIEGLVGGRSQLQRYIIPMPFQPPRGVAS